MHTVSVHILDPDTNVRAFADPTGRIVVSVEGGEARLDVTLASQVGHKGLFPDPMAFAALLEVAARDLRRLAAPTDLGDHFIRPTTGLVEGTVA